MRAQVQHEEAGWLTERLDRRSLAEPVPTVALGAPESGSIT